MKRSATLLFALFFIQSSTGHAVNMKACQIVAAALPVVLLSGSGIFGITYSLKHGTHERYDCEEWEAIPYCLGNPTYDGKTLTIPADQIRPDKCDGQRTAICYNQGIQLPQKIVEQESWYGATFYSSAVATVVGIMGSAASFWRLKKKGVCCAGANTDSHSIP